MFGILDRFPILKVIFPVLLGVYLSSIFSVPIEYSIVLCLGSLVLSIAFFVRAQSFVFWICMSISFFSLGLSLMPLKDTFRPKLPKGIQAYKAKIRSSKYKGAYDNRFQAKVIAYKKDSLWYKTDVNVMLTIDKSLKLKKGYAIYAKGLLDTIPSKNYFAVFDYKKFLYYRGIDYTLNLRDIRSVDSSEQSILDRAFNYCERVLDIHLEEPMYQAVAKALLLGDKSLLDPRLKGDYRTSGVSHILVISGMHISIIYAVIVYLLSFQGIRRAKLWVDLIACGFVWSYAIMIGLPNAVFRASLMLSIWVVCKHIGRESLIYGTLGLVLLIVAIQYTNLLFDLGFQLSIAAVYSIVILFPLFKVRTPYRIINFFADIFSVSLSVQIGILPMVLYYFHAFPPWFLLANLCVLTFIFPFLSVAFQPFCFIQFLLF